MLSKNVRDSIDNANDIVNGPWPRVWKYPVPSQADEVWKILGPARDQIEASTKQPFQCLPNESPGSMVTRVRAGAFDAALGRSPVVPGTKI